MALNWVTCSSILYQQQKLGDLAANLQSFHIERANIQWIKKIKKVQLLEIKWIKRLHCGKRGLIQFSIIVFASFVSVTDKMV